MAQPHWKNCRVKDCIKSLESGVSVNGEDRTPDSSEPAVLKISSVTYGKFNQTAAKPIFGNELARAKCTPKAGQIIISRSNTPSLVGASAFIEQNYPNRFLPDKLWQTVTHDSVCTRWLFYFLSSAKSRAQLTNLATGTSNSMKNITKGELLSLKMSLPPHPEQKAISDTLATWDKAIEKTQRLIAAKELRLERHVNDFCFGKQGEAHAERIQTKWFSIPSDWKLCEIGDIAKEVSRPNSKNEDIPVLSSTKHSGLVRSLEYFGKRIFSADTSRYKVVKQGEFAYATNHIEEGSIGYQFEHESGLVSPMYTVFETTKEIDNEYLYRVLKTKLYTQIFSIHTNASVDRRGSLRWKAFSKLPIPLPPIKTQREIAVFLNTALREVDLHKSLLNKLEKQKHGLMQKLLSGTWKTT